MTDIFYYPARVVRAQGPLAQLFPSDEELLARYRQRFPDSPAEALFFLKVEISNNSLDWYYTHMLTSSLKNYAEDAEAGVGLQDSHDFRRLGYGRSLFGLYDSAPGTPPGWDRLGRRGDAGRPAIDPPDIYERTLSAAYVVPGIKMAGVTFASTDDFIRAVEAGSVEEVSIGYGGGSEHCDICGARYWSWDCPHIAGFTYDIEVNGEPSTVLGTVSVNNARLMEYSAVYAGATPNAVVVRKAEQEAEGGRLSPKQAAVIEQRYRVKLPTTRNWAGFSEKEQERGENDMAETIDFQQIRAILAEVGAEGETALEQVRWLVAENARLAPLADQGRQYHADLVAEALAEGVRALGESFPKETYEAMLRDAPIGHVKKLRDAWHRQGNERLGGPRHTTDEEEPTEPAEQAEQPAPRTVPDHAYKS